MNGSEEAKDAAMEALALAETHNLPRVASDATTTLVGLNRKVPMAELAAALEDAARRARETGAVNSELRALYLLGRGYQDRGHLSRGGRRVPPGQRPGRARPAPRGRRGPSTRASSRRRSPTSPASGTGCWR